MITPDNFTRINNDVNGNPRYVCHYTHLSWPVDVDAPVTQRYDIALRRAKNLGGKKFHNKQYGGGIVFQSYNLRDTCELINKVIGVLNG